MKPIIVDHNINKKECPEFVCIFVEVGMGTQMLEVVIYKNGKGKLIEQPVHFDWKPILCNFCKIILAWRGGVQTFKKVPKIIQIPPKKRWKECWNYTRSGN